MTDIAVNIRPMPLTDRSEELNGRCRIRTCDRLIKSQQNKNNNHNKDKDLPQTPNGAYKPAYKENQKTAKNRPENLPPELAEILAVWPDLPEHIKAAIKALVEAHKANKG